MYDVNDENLRYSCNFKNNTNQEIYNYENSKCLSIGNKAPNFTANTTFGECSLSDYKRKMGSIF